MRIENSIKNTVASVVTNLVTILIGFIAQAVFVKSLGIEYLGINGLFTNIISMLCIVEFGIASAIIYSLYKPLAENNQERIKSLMQFYKKTYHVIAIIILVLGLLLLPSLNFFIKDLNISNNINIIYMLFIIDAVCSYLLSYKRSILYADQKNYILNIIHIFYLIILNTIQISFLLITKDYYIYLIIKVLMRVLENVVITIITNKKYSYLKDKDITALDTKTKTDIFTKVKALGFHKIGSFVISSTDNIIISKFLGIMQVGLYSNYYLIINSVQILFSQIISSLTASVGNLLVTSDKEKTFQVFKRIRFINFWLSCFGGVSILVIMNSFITLWIGSKYILPTLVLVTLVINYYQNTIRNSYSIFKEASGIFYEDRFIPIIESIINIVFSIILLKYFGLAGVFMGTITSGLIIHFYSYPKYVYKKLFERSYLLYLKETFLYLMIFLIILFITYKISIILVISNLLLKVIINCLICLIIPNLLIILIFRKQEEYKYIINLLINIIKRKKVK